MRGATDRDGPRHPGALLRRRLDPQAATESAQPVLHVDKPRTGAAVAGLEPLAIVADVEAERGPVGPDSHFEPGPVPSRQQK